MTTNELSRPLGTGSRKARALPSIPIRKPLIFVGIAAVAGLGAWIILTEDPLGGEPQAVATIIRRTTPVAAAPNPQDPPLPIVSTPGGGPVVGPGSSSAGSASGEVVIRPVGPGDADAPGAGPGSGPMVIRVPGSPGSDAGGATVRDPDPKLIEQVAGLDLPRVGADGTRPMTAYARPSAAMLDPRPKVALLIGGLGVSENVTAEAIAKLPADISLAFAPYGEDLERWSSKARGDGHEYMLQLPMEPFDYPNNDPGPQTLLTSEPDPVNLERLRWILGRMRGYVGVANFMGARFTSSEGSLAPVMTEIGRRGLMFVDDGSSPRSLTETLAEKTGATARRARVVIDSQTTPSEIDAALARLEDIARSDGMAIGIGSTLPITIDRVAEWAKGLNSRGFVLVPVSAIVNHDKPS
ncbi:hypothetical protein GCM10007276_00130 [Agaricicola taiwanensis]|uniref:Divergent polysaccharide deacetylase family protein n=1 Tax=Agaricicola taiwanensis TaxID=591372 RepID=A0A8J2VK06_9RHOB|nr:divergent polysaccharide deacetylase family protein [Agaricicola taiwanensis]GGE26971.1 hypothetical protein GCM10007276_00130 [Agaricicola taiwanensis]